MNNLTSPPDQPAYWFIFSCDRLVHVSEQPGLYQSEWHALTFIHAYQDSIVQFSEHKGLPCYLVDMGKEEVSEQGWETASLRSLLLKSPISLLGLFAHAWQIALFLRTHRFCGQCGARMHQLESEMAMHCYQCGHRAYPRISPCIIVAIRDDNKLLLAQGKAHQSRQMYSTLAGFVESGESIEEAVHREVYEEVGVTVKNLEYFGSQPWPFPHSLMLGFLAEYDGGEIQIDAKEIFEADWFDYDDLPIVPPTLSIAGQLIQETVSRIKQTKKAP